MFLRDEKFRPIGCIAISVNRQRARIRYQVSVLNPIDKFERDLARHIALGRLLEKPFVISMKGDCGWDINYAVMSSLEKNKDVPTRAQKAAKHWLDDNL